MNNDKMTSPTPKPRAGEHAKGPWRFVQEDNAIVGADGFLISDCVPRSADFGMKERDANARRIVACVNYCEGIATNFLEGASIGQPVFPEAERDALKLLNVELREVLDQFCGFIAAGCAEAGTIEGYRPTLAEIERKARALLTRSTDRRE